MTTLLWQRETVSVCMSVLSVGWGGHLGFLQRVKQTEWGRFTSPLEQTDNIDTVCHNKKQTEPKFQTHQNEAFMESLSNKWIKSESIDFLLTKCVFLVIKKQIIKQPKYASN